MGARDYRRQGADAAPWLTPELEGGTGLVPHVCPETEEKATDVSEFNETKRLQRCIHTIFKQ